MEPQRTWQQVGLVGLAVLSGLGATSLAVELLSPEAPLSLAGLRLGMTPDDVRARFSPGLGTFRSEVSGTDTALVWEAPGSEPARFEFHDGQLVAVRVSVLPDSPDAGGPALDITPATLLRRAPRSDGRIDLLLLSRTCPTHRDEADRIAAGAAH